jgi:hypothetical protein
MASAKRIRPLAGALPNDDLPANRRPTYRFLHYSSTTSTSAYDTIDEPIQFLPNGAFSLSDQIRKIQITMDFNNATPHTHTLA